MVTAKKKNNPISPLTMMKAHCTDESSIKALSNRMTQGIPSNGVKIKVETSAVLIICFPFSFSEPNLVVEIRMTDKMSITILTEVITKIGAVKAQIIPSAFFKKQC